MGPETPRESQQRPGGGTCEGGERGRGQSRGDVVSAEHLLSISTALYVLCKYSPTEASQHPVCFIDRETEAQRGRVNCLRLHSQKVAVPKLEPRSSVPRHTGSYW